MEIQREQNASSYVFMLWCDDNQTQYSMKSLTL